MSSIEPVESLVHNDAFPTILVYFSKPSQSKLPFHPKIYCWLFARAATPVDFQIQSPKIFLINVSGNLNIVILGRLKLYKTHQCVVVRSFLYRPWRSLPLRRLMRNMIVMGSPNCTLSHPIFTRLDWLKMHLCTLLYGILLFCCHSWI